MTSRVSDGGRMSDVYAAVNVVGIEEVTILIQAKLSVHVIRDSLGML